MITLRQLKSPKILKLPALSIALTLAATQALADDDGAALLVGFVVISLIATLLYMIPTIVAFCRTHPNRWLIAVVNITLGGTGIGWLGALVWACSAAHLSATGNNGGESGLNLLVNDTKRVKIEPMSRQADFENISAQLLRLKRLRDDGALTAEEYNDLKRPLIATL